MNTVHQTPDSVALKQLRLAVTEETTLQHLVSHFEKRRLMNYTELLDPTRALVAESVADTALANVYRVELLNRHSVAVKCVKHNTPYKRLKRAARELDCWLSHKHENILPVLGFAVVGTNLAMVSPWMNNGHVTDYVATNPNCDRLTLCVQLAKAVAYLHENSVVHGDIKGPNVLVSDQGAIQVTDFGVSIMDHQEIEFSVTSSGRGTQRWQAPEILLGQSDSTKRADVYALSMTMIEIYTGEQPYGSTNWLQIMIPVLSGQLRPSRPIRLPIDENGNGVWKLMNYCWMANPSERPTSTRVYEWLLYYSSMRATA
ncbi:tyrosine kinase catalytic domain protein [Rhizoctonia solani AG-3 Rhs1AP]|uniref:Tyrosine kinase catalytic domain protein n=1 Tax=Rhizoctonia solani AG-3 Rhs1AP TaxID=1086054 RepID=X8J0E8_9AGAM|nr:tyrosine kinase catalytic domain protein [Rhizoctonia solani AG-3 Rhs1AP]